MKIIKALFVLFVVSLNAHSQSNIRTIAGGSIGDGQIATNVGLNIIPGIAVDSEENIYFVDRSFYRIRKISSPTNIISTVGGIGNFGNSGDGGNALLATFTNPQSIKLDRYGNIYISDVLNSNIRKINASTRVITTIAGSRPGSLEDGVLAINAYLINLQDFTLDTAGNIFVLTNNKVRKIAASTGVITTIAGNGTTGSGGNGGLAINAQLGNPNAIAIDLSGNIYIADNNNNVIRMINATTGIISVVAGNGLQGFSGDGEQATSAQIAFPSSLAVDNVGNIFITDNNRIRKISGGIITTIGGGAAGYSGDGGQATSAALRNPRALTVSPSGNVYFNDVSNHVIRKINTSTGIINTVAGNGTTGYSGIGGPAINAQLYMPKSIAVDSAKNIYLADNLNYKIYKITNSTGIISTVAGTGQGGLNPASGVPALSTSISDPVGISVDKEGNFYFIASTNVHKVNATTGIITRVAGNGNTFGYSGDGGPATSATLNRAAGTAIDKFGNLYIADQQNHCIRKVTAATGIISTVGGSGVSGYTGDGSTATAARLNMPIAVTVDNKGNIYISDNGNSVVRRVDAITGIITTFAGSGVKGYGGDDSVATSAKLNYPYGLATDTAGNVYIADQFNSRLRKVTIATGIISRISGMGTTSYNGDNIEPAFALLNNPTSLAVDEAGTIYIADNANNRIRTITVDTAERWIGSVSSDWNTAGNWSNNKVPDPNSNIVIPATTSYKPMISSGSVTANNLQLQGSGILALNGGTLTINNILSGTGTLSGSKAAGLVINGTGQGSAGTLNFTEGFRELSNLTVNLTGFAGSITIGTPLTISGNLNVVSGSLSIPNVEMKSAVQ